jgi:hypothetical protein
VTDSGAAGRHPRLDPSALADVVDAPSPTGAARLLSSLMSSMRGAGVKAVASGRWAADTVVELAPRIPLRDLETLSAHHGGKTGLPRALISQACKASAAIGAAAGALVSAQELAPPTWIVIPGELVVETVAIASVELKLVAELHEVFGAPVDGSSGDRSLALLKSWADRRGMTPSTIARPSGLANAIGRTTRAEVVRVVRRRILRRLGRNATAVLPALVGAVAGAELNRRATRSLGEAIVADLRP